MSGGSGGVRGGLPYREERESGHFLFIFVSKSCCADVFSDSSGLNAKAEHR